MTKEVLVTVSGIQALGEMEDDNEEVLELVAPGEFYDKGDKKYILYDEIMEGFDGVNKNRIKIDKDRVEILKKGVASTHMIFQKNIKNLTYYNTPFGKIQIGMEASDIKIHEREDFLNVDIAYELEANCEHVADCNISIQVQSKNGTEFSLS